MKNYKWLLLSVVFVSTLFGQIDIKPVDLYKLKKKLGNTYVVKLDGKKQTLIRLEGTIPEKSGYHRVTWKTTEKYFWSNGTATDEFKVVNPASYSKNGKVYTMFGPLPEMKGKTVVVTATYGEYTDTINFELK
jgi:hypothetical protein|tara:strand:+ start:101 stop:499 length:399 start_codon:yes stop_codon:yes gene_type:complete